MSPDEYAMLLGKLVANFHSLEFILRAFLYANAIEPHEPLPTGMGLESLDLGESGPVNALTDYDTLAKLIARYKQGSGRRAGSLAMRPCHC